ncbi:hypothetical protein [Peterkaempfera griseoplana]|uniref:hypothetical protein n=1 Tax=Peterkaempfera griseoplana TaxID=66896 RepID=UPI0006E1B45F|nr:hypothetical protein [Peterkaempfera griseoplana]
MTDIPAPSPGAPKEVLADLGELSRRVRAAQRGTWFPLLLFGLLTLGAVLANRLTFSVRTITSCPDLKGTATECTLVRQGAPGYWVVGLTLAYAATAFFYVRRSRSRGVGTPVRPYVVTGLVLVAVLGATTLWTIRNGFPQPGDRIDFWGLHLDPGSGPTQLLERFTGSALTVGIPLLVLSWVERNRALLLFTLAYLALELAPISTGWAGVATTSPWSSLPRLALPALFLLLGALGFTLAQQPRGRTA